MTFGFNFLRSQRLLVALALLLVPAIALAGDKASQRKPVPKMWQFNPDHESVEMFKAIEDGQIEVKLIPKDSTQSRVMIENKTDKPLNIKLPEAFAGVPVLAQVGGAAGGGFNNNGGGMQQFGGGMGGMGGMGMGGMGMGMMNIPPEKVGKLKITTVCLEHGKPEPRPAGTFEIKPVEEATDKAGVKELCQMLGTGQLNQRVAQVAAWHLNNGMSFQELAAKRIQHADGGSEPYFSPMEIQAGMKITARALQLAKENQKSDSLSKK